MVVMEMLDATVYKMYADKAVRWQFPSIRSLEEKVKNLVAELHGGGFVHGDIRDANIMVKLAAAAESEVEVKLLDFDWAGKEGEACYPGNVNHEGVSRPHGAKDGLIIEREHDLFMIKELFTDS